MGSRGFSNKQINIIHVLKKEVHFISHIWISHFSAFSESWPWKQTCMTFFFLKCPWLCRYFGNCIKKQTIKKHKYSFQPLGKTALKEIPANAKCGVCSTSYFNIADGSPHWLSYKFLQQISFLFLLFKAWYKEMKLSCRPLKWEWWFKADLLSCIASAYCTVKLIFFKRWGISGMKLRL